MLVRIDNDFPSHLRESGYEYFLEVHIARDEVLGEWYSQLTKAQRLDVLLFYAENDCWPDWFNEYCQSRGV